MPPRATFLKKWPSEALKKNRHTAYLQGVEAGWHLLRKNVSPGFVKTRILWSHTNSISITKELIIFLTMSMGIEL